jgi:4-amino-4-deoxy-L-arabinose transferase-like glycosyltransferase
MKDNATKEEDMVDYRKIGSLGITSAKSDHSILVVIVLLAVALRVLYAILLPVEPFSDGAWYLQRARELANGMPYQEGGHPTAYWPVGYPALLSVFIRLFGDTQSSYVIPNIVASAITIALIYWFAIELTKNSVIGKIAAFGYAIYPNHIAYTNQPVTETIYTSIYLCALAALIKYRDKPLIQVIAGLLFGAATLIKAQTVLFPIGCLILIWISFKDVNIPRLIKNTVAVYLGLLLVVLPWSARNYVNFNQFVLVSTNGGVALLIGASDYATGDHVEVAKTPLIEEIGIPWEERVERQIEWDARHKELAVEWIKANPAEYGMLIPKKVLSLWIKDTDGFWALANSQPRAQGSIFLAQILNQIVYTMILCFSMYFAIMIVFEAIRRTEPISTACLLFAMPIFVTILAAVFTGQIRYHYPAMPLLFICAAAGFLKAFGAVRLIQAIRTPQRG